MAILLRAGVALIFWYSPPSASRPDASKDIFRALCYVSLAYAFDLSSWTLRALLRRRTGPILQHLTTRTIPTGWTSVGCVTDGAARALSYFYTSTSLTQDSCVTTCDSKGYTYAGLEYADECWCGSSLANSLGVATDASQCNMKCTGNSGELCGAGYRLTLFKKITTVPATGWTLSNACAVDSASRILQGYSVTTSSNTPTTCQATCAGKGYTIAGVENGNECYCANSFTGGTPAAASASDL
ncbi:WSC domain-containing protein [Mycena olivaceomarginata]|nr:WSC domain-containing protein [Mycena olivaceomarginata]